MSLIDRAKCFPTPSKVELSLTCEDFRLVEDAVVAGVGHEDVGWVLLSALVPQQWDLVAVLDDLHLVDGRPHRALNIRDLVVDDVWLKKKRKNFSVFRHKGFFVKGGLGLGVSPSD